MGCGASSAAAGGLDEVGMHVPKQQQDDPEPDIMARLAAARAKQQAWGEGAQARRAAQQAHDAAVYGTAPAATVVQQVQTTAAHQSSQAQPARKFVLPAPATTYTDAANNLPTDLDGDAMLGGGVGGILGALGQGGMQFSATKEMRGLAQQFAKSVGYFGDPDDPFVESMTSDQMAAFYDEQVKKLEDQLAADEIQAGDKACKETRELAAAQAIKANIGPGGFTRQVAYAKVSKRNMAIDSGRAGISLQFVLDMLQQEIPVASGWGTQAICDHIVKPRTVASQLSGTSPPSGAGGFRYIDIIPEQYVSSPPTFFLSHTWQGNLLAQLQTVVQYCRQVNMAPSSCFLWIDVFVLDQNDENVAAKGAKAMADGVRCAQRVLVYLDDRALALRRVWCLYEVWMALKVEQPIELATAASRAQLLSMMASIRIERANAKNPSDKKMVMDGIVASGMSLDQINSQLEEAIARLMRDRA